MNVDVFGILTKAISDVGFFRWYYIENGIAQVEFGGVQLYNPVKTGKKARSSIIALRFYSNEKIVFCDKGEMSGKDWIEDLYYDKIESFNIEYDSFFFNDHEKNNSILNEFKIRKTFPKDINLEEISNSKYTLCFKCSDVAIIVAGDNISVYGEAGELNDENIIKYSDEWWNYWKDYWNKMKTDDAYDKDYACEVTIPARNA